MTSGRRRAFIVSIAVLSAAAFFVWRTIMSDPANVQNCRILNAAEFEETFHVTDKIVSPVTPDQAVPMQFRLEFPVSVPKDAHAVFSISHASGSGDFVLYSGPAQQNLDTDVSFPHRPDFGYPNGGYAQVSLFLPKQRAICNWGGEELILLAAPDHPRAFKIELLSGSYKDDEGTIRRTVISPL